jgi:hypothetical protein
MPATRLKKATLHRDRVLSYAQRIGLINWPAIKTRAGLLGSFPANPNEEHRTTTHHVDRYIRFTKHQGTQYGGPLDDKHAYYAKHMECYGISDSEYAEDSEKAWSVAS